MTACTHLDTIHVTSTDLNVCETCVAMGDTWVNLRLCLSCGHVGCCDASKNTHATKHFKATNHPIVQSLKPTDHWRWCYIDEVKMEDF